MPRFQILSLIGGGIRGAFVTSLLYHVEQKLGRPISECFDLIAGTSTGGIIAAGLASGMTAEDLQRFYQNHGAKIFSPRPPYQAKGLLRFVFPAVNWGFRRRTGSGLESAFRARFCPFELEDAFDIAFGDKRLKDVRQTRLIIPTVNLTRGQPQVFRSPHLPKGIHDQELRLSDVVIAATAAPTYFPHKQIGESSFVDGGVWANDPSVLAIAEAMRVQQIESSGNGSSGAPSFDLSDVQLLSIGTGRAQFSLAPPGADAGLLYWAPHVADVMGTSQTQGTHLPLTFMLGDRYRHLNFKMTERWDLADVTRIPDLFEVGEQCAEQNFEMLQTSFLQHQRVPYTPCTSADNEALFDDDYSIG